MKIHGLKKADQGQLLLEIQRAWLYRSIKRSGPPLNTETLNALLSTFSELHSLGRRAVGIVEETHCYEGPDCRRTVTPGYTYYRFLRSTNPFCDSIKLSYLGGFDFYD